MIINGKKKKEFNRKRREERAAEKRKAEEKEESESLSGSNETDADSLLNLEEIKKEMESLKEESSLLKGKKQALHVEIREINVLIKTKRQEEIVDKEAILGFRESIQNKRDSITKLVEQMNQTKTRLANLRELAATKKE